MLTSLVIIVYTLFNLSITCVYIVYIVEIATCMLTIASQDPAYIVYVTSLYLCVYIVPIVDIAILTVASIVYQVSLSLHHRHVNSSKATLCSYFLLSLYLFLHSLLHTQSDVDNLCQHCFHIWHTKPVPLCLHHYIMMLTIGVFTSAMSRITHIQIGIYAPGGKSFQHTISRRLHKDASKS